MSPFRHSGRGSRVYCKLPMPCFFNVRKISSRVVINSRKEWSCKGCSSSSLYASKSCGMSSKKTGTFSGDFRVIMLMNNRIGINALKIG